MRLRKKQKREAGAGQGRVMATGPRVINCSVKAVSEIAPAPVVRWRLDARDWTVSEKKNPKERSDQGGPEPRNFRASENRLLTGLFPLSLSAYQRKRETERGSEGWGGVPCF